MAEGGEIRPALTVEEWRERRANRGGYEVAVDEEGGLTITQRLYGDWGQPDSIQVTLPREASAVLAALALCGQPFGFTWGDVHALRECLWSSEEGRQELRAVGHVIERIAALLPPENGQ